MSFFEIISLSKISTGKKMYAQKEKNHTDPMKCSTVASIAESGREYFLFRIVRIKMLLAPLYSMREMRMRAAAE